MIEDLHYPGHLESLMELLRTLPGVGKRAAERMVLAMLKWDTEKQSTFGRLMLELHENVISCPECGAIAEAGKRCPVCGDSGRDRSCLCVVEDPQQIFAVEKSGTYHGLYHVLGGRLSPLSGNNGENMTTEKLLERASRPECREVILALGADVEGRATAVFLAELLKKCDVRVSQPALGLPAGAGIGYADGATIAAALAGRKEF